MKNARMEAGVDSRGFWGILAGPNHESETLGGIINGFK